ncbi:hypothetical protein FB45DRAFT_864655 [Roridomyces roridus]|uniref:Uncharacterized protein n=1 Tax=Roridomyces roridus TaxID=1738132 RepID=A0AAD7C1I2_9AGAR|nr:hypothetical protein FB45DRAFT_864655 [Roridomyces roridus]
MNKLHLDGWRDVTVVRENLGNAQCRQQSVAGSITQLPCLLESLRHAIKFMSPWITGSMDIISAFSQISIFTDSFASQLQGVQQGHWKLEWPQLHINRLQETYLVENSVSNQHGKPREARNSEIAFLGQKRSGYNWKSASNSLET